MCLSAGSPSAQDGSDAATSSRVEQGLIVLVSVITSCLQTLHCCDSKLAALELILHLAPRLGVDVLLDRITPYLLHFCNDPMPRVRAQAVRTLAKVLALVKEVPRNDVNIYPEYILPGIAHLAQDDATIVRLAYAGDAETPQSRWVWFGVRCSHLPLVLRKHRSPGRERAAFPGAGPREQREHGAGPERRRR